MTENFFSKTTRKQRYLIALYPKDMEENPGLCEKSVGYFLDQLREITMEFIPPERKKARKIRTQQEGRYHAIHIEDWLKRIKEDVKLDRQAVKRLWILPDRDKVFRRQLSARIDTFMAVNNPGKKWRPVIERVFLFDEQHATEAKKRRYKADIKALAGVIGVGEPFPENVPHTVNEKISWIINGLCHSSMKQTGATFNHTAVTLSRLLNNQKIPTIYNKKYTRETINKLINK